MVNVNEFIGDATASIHDQIGGEHAIVALSGGVDSSVVATLAYEVVGEQLIPAYVDTGLMHKGGTEQIADTSSFMESLRVVDTRDRFFNILEGVVDPEERHKVIDEQFIHEFEREVKKTDAQYLVQGTICPDRIEPEGNIKSHHNADGLPGVVNFEGIVEPVCDLYKDGVREVAHTLGLESIITERMPFPGPGLTVHVFGEVTPERMQIARDACHVIEDETGKHDPWQASAAVTGKGTDVKGDNRVHDWIASVRSMELRDGMTAHAQELLWGTLQRIQSRITGTSEDVARAVYDVTHKPPATIRCE